MDINMIAAIGRDGALGLRGGLIWRIPGDLKRFRRLTTGHPVIMGRKTWESLPKRPLPGRTNIVVTRTLGYEAPGAVVVTGPEEAVAAASAAACAPGGNAPSPFVMGGAETYRLFMPVATRLYLTLIDGECPEADARFDWNPGEWAPDEETAPETSPDGTEYRYAVFSRK